MVAVVGAAGVAYAAFIFAFDRRFSSVIGPAWIRAVAPLKVLCIYGLLQGFLAIGRSFLSGLGKPERYVIAGRPRRGSGHRDLSIDGMVRRHRCCRRRGPIDFGGSADNRLLATANGIGQVK